MIVRLIVAFLLVIAPFWFGEGGRVFASEPKVVTIDPLIQDARLAVNADVDFPLNDQLRDAAQRGLPLYFTADIKITKARWWWFDRSIVDTSMTWRVSYNALTRQWRVGQGELSLNVASLDDAMDVVRRIRDWRVAQASEFEAGEVYNGQLRVRLDTSLLARPFQVNALNSSAWAAATPWREFSFTLTEPARDPS
ncbi:DUF4390 domain-containing protein [Bordetella hinzii]|uniref:DUF4390 domain-containing protein n=1 Tax=Bordetella hinzii TaxID=103855 RepID=UPI000495F242|nr:DUF4390 domain-containing protein [Bordetella hinzii]AKQ53641.1 hypothetical protein ACR54_00283 [Bordetella hinzii]QDJ50039.1 hypothetical protein CBR69_06760 [Bordetella hinzii]SNV99628.1 Uncharacterised protein [Bordetella hinzii]